MKTSRNYKVGVITQDQVTPKELATLATRNILPCQRDHGGMKVAAKKHIRGVLIGNAQKFSAVYVTTLKKLFLLDGYHRVEALGSGQVTYDPKFPLYLDTYTVKTMDDAESLYNQFNSLAAAKRAECYFASGLRACGLLDLLHSPFIRAKGRVTAVQYASGLGGSLNTMAATIAMKDELVLLNSYGLNNCDQMGGVKAVYFAAAKHCVDKKLVKYFVTNVNALRFQPNKASKADLAIAYYRRVTENRETRTGGGANKELFQQGLAYFVNFMNASRRRTRAVVYSTLSLTQFRELMAEFK